MRIDSSFDLRRTAVGLYAALLLTCAPNATFGFAFATLDNRGNIAFNQTTGTPIVWRNPFIRVLVGFGSFPPGFMPINGSASWDANALQALSEWTAVQGSRVVFFGFQQAGDVCGLGDQVVTSGWAADNCGVPFGDAVALTRIQYQLSGDGAEIVDADVLVNSTLFWNAYDGPIRTDAGGNTILDFRRIVLHEYGHILGLAHPDLAGQVVIAVMNSTFGPGSDTDRLTSDDKNGAIALYRAVQSSGGGGGGSSAFDPALALLIFLILALRTCNRPLIRRFHLAAADTPATKAKGPQP